MKILNIRLCTLMIFGICASVNTAMATNLEQKSEKTTIIDYTANQPIPMQQIGATSQKQLIKTKTATIKTVSMLDDPKIVNLIRNNLSDAQSIHAAYHAYLETNELKENPAVEREEKFGKRANNFYYLTTVLTPALLSLSAFLNTYSPKAVQILSVGNVFVSVLGTLFGHLGDKALAQVLEEEKSFLAARVPYLPTTNKIDDVI